MGIRIPESALCMTIAIGMNIKHPRNWDQHYAAYYNDDEEMDLAAVETVTRCLQ